MKKHRTLTRSSRHHIRTEKAKIRKIADPALRAQKTVELYAKFGVTFSGKE
ncbi:MAG TPA: hypothetical protein VL426_01510 [Candidatus Binatia bacterium]|jgi:hypothetical protein|nr:hypothetical protein [Candidatus Binatia bacterium]